MGVYIKGMKMPRSCVECPCSLNLFFCMANGGKSIADKSSIKVGERNDGVEIHVGCPDWCPMIEIPSHGRLIDADALLEQLEILFKKRADDAIYSGRKELQVSWNDAIYAIKSAPTIESEKHWILCSDRLPHTNGIYIVTRRISDGFECQNITDACYFDGSNTWHDDTRVNHERKYLADVLAWQPLPEPYREKE